jgi:hypothetical protein
MIWNYDKYSKWNTKNLTKSVHFQNSYFFKFDCKQTYDILGATINTINKKFQNISFENSSLWKHVFWQNDPKKDNSLKCKINTLACYMSFAPK